MSDTPPEGRSNSKSNLIEVQHVQHVGVTAKLQSPLKCLMDNYSSSTDTEPLQVLYKGDLHKNSSKYNKFSNVRDEETESTEPSKLLYEMKTIKAKSTGLKSSQKITPSKIEFQLYKKSNPRHSLKTKRSAEKSKTSKRQLFKGQEKNSKSDETLKSSTIFQRMRESFAQMSNSKMNNQPSVDKLLNDLPEPEIFVDNPQTLNGQTNQNHRAIGIYLFEHGSAEYLKTHDCPPHVISLMLADRATQYATKFWAEFFGGIQIAVAFFVTFLLQCYRFLLYSLINTLVVGFLHMTSDYLFKPLLTVVFNGFLQPPLIFLYNILSSIRDIMEPISDTIDNFMKPIATVGRSVRLVHATYNKKNISRSV